MVPDLRWFGGMLQGQVRAALAARVLRLSTSVPAPLRSPRVMRRLDGLLGRVSDRPEGQLPPEGDSEFAYRRVAGVNPLTLARVEGLDDLHPKLRLSDAQLSKLLGSNQSLAERLGAGDLYQLDLSSLRTPKGTDLQAGKFVAASVGLFCHAPGVDSRFPLVPLAIECAAGAADGDTTVVTPLDGERWAAAKHILNAADINYSELCLHLARAHLMTSPFAIALHRNLSKGHPIYQFLLPHLRFELFVEKMAWEQGIKKTTGILVSSLAGTADWSQEVAKTLHQRFSFREQNFHQDLRARGMDETPFAYPYRDDGRLLWGALERFVRAYVELSYPSEDQLHGDKELAAFLAEVASPNGGNVRGLFAGRHLAEREELIEILTQLLFVAGPLHALFHYGSSIELRDLDHNPSFLLGNPLVVGNKALPGLEAIEQYTRAVSTHMQYGRLGDFSGYPIDARPECAALLRCFAAELEEIERRIEQRNVERFAPFVHFLPSRVSNGITV
ncbi:lipoxygenase family protein [Enhygromyxa salina]|nr:lipoxygenase family protein [Enhygromyxa salina]